MQILSSDTYYNIPVKDTAGRPNQIYYDKQLTSGIINLWPVPENSTNKIEFTFISQLFDFDAATDDPDFPQEWFHPLVWNLANELSTEYGVFGERAAKIEAKANQSLQKALDWDKEPVSVRFQPGNAYIEGYI